MAFGRSGEVSVLDADFTDIEVDFNDVCSEAIV